MKSKHIKTILTFIMIVTLLLPFCTLLPVSAEVMQPTALNGVNSERKLNYLIAYTDAYESDSTGTDDKGTEAIVNSDGVVTSVGGNNNDIPNGGFVISGSSTKKTYIEKNIKVGYQVALNEEAQTILVIPEGYTPFSSSTIEYNAYNTTRYENTLVIFDGSDHKTTTGTNEWGYEVVVNADGFIISLGSNNNAIPEGGFVLSAIGTKKATLTEMAQIGMSVKIDSTSKIITISYSKENAIESPRLLLEGYKTAYNEAKALYRNLDYTALQNKISELESEFNIIKTAITEENMLAYTVSQNKFDEISVHIDTLLVESPAVEGRALWIRPTEKNEDAVKKVIKEIYESGFNIICIETLYNNTVITPMAEGSLLSQNPDFKNFDVLAAYVTECHKYGIELHCWMPVFRVAHSGSTNPSLGLNVKKPEWLNISNTGINYVANTYGNGYFLNPALPEVQDYLISYYTYVLETYAIDGFQLDYIRYPDLVDGVDYGYDEYTRNLFLAEYGKDPLTMSSGDALWSDWVAFRAQFVTDLVLKVKALIEEKRPDIYLACDVAPSYNESLSRMKQDTIKWISEPYVNIVYPMAYGTVDRVKTWTKTTISTASQDVFTYIGVGDYGAKTLFEQIAVIRESGGNGVAFFAYQQFSEGDYESIPETIFARHAISPTYSGKKAMIAQLKCTKNRIKNVIVPSAADGAAELEAICTDIDTILAKFEADASLADCAADLENLSSAISTVLTEKVTDEKLSDAVSADLKVIDKICKNTKDDAKQAYYAEHPLPDMYDLPEEEDISTIDETSTTEENKTELNTVEKIFQKILLVIIIIPVLGLPLYFVLDARKKRLLKEYNDTHSDDQKDKENDEEESKDE